MKQTVTAWEALEQVCGIAQVIPSIELQQLILRAPKDAFKIKGQSSTSPYQFVFGANDATLLEVDLKKKFLRNRRGIRLIAFDPTKRSNADKGVLTVDYPPDSQIPPKKRPKMTRSKHQKTAATKSDRDPPDPPPRDVYHVGKEGYQHKDLLQQAAERFWRERSRQEMEGTLKTAVWDQNLFTLRHASRIQIRVNPVLEAELRARDDEQLKVDFLKTRLRMNDEAARLLLNGPAKDIFDVRSITHDWSVKSGGRTSVDFVNITDVDLTQGF